MNVVKGLDFNNMSMDLFLDANATKGAISRKGVGRMKHIEVKHLWIQQAVHEKRFTCHKIARSVNCADLLTHPWTKADGTKHLGRMNVKEAEVATKKEVKMIAGLWRSEGRQLIQKGMPKPAMLPGQGGVRAE